MSANPWISYTAFDDEGNAVFDCDAPDKAGAVIKLSKRTGLMWPTLYANGFRIYKINDRNGVMEDTGRD